MIANTFPSPGGQSVVESALAAGQPVIGLVHDIDYFTDRGGAQQALERHPNLWLAHAGVSPSAGVERLPAELRRRVGRFFPVLRFDARAWRRAGVALPGALEYARRDFSTALRLTADSRIPLKIFGRSHDQGDGPKAPRDLNKERGRLLDEIERRGVGSDVSISSDVSCGDFYRAVSGSRFVALLSVAPEYLLGKLTGAITAAVSCGVPMLALPALHAHYRDADPDAFADCIVPFDPQAPAGRDDSWSSIVDRPPIVYEQLCRAALRARDSLLAQNAATLRRVAGAGAVSSAGL